MQLNQPHFEIQISLAANKKITFEEINILNLVNIFHIDFKLVCTCINLILGSNEWFFRIHFVV